MGRVRFSVVGLVGLLLLAVPAAAAPAYERAIERAKRAVDSGNVDPERDLGPLVDALRNARTADDQKRLISKIEDLGDADGSAPAAAKRYLLTEATPILKKLARDGKDTFVRGDAIIALRDMGAPRAVLEEVAAMAEKASAKPRDVARSAFSVVNVTPVKFRT